MIQLFTGENTFEIERQLQLSMTGYDGDVQKVDGAELTIDMLPDLLTGVTLFSSKRLIVMKNVSDNKTVWAELGQWLEKAGDTEVICAETHPDKRTKTYKWFEKNAKVVYLREMQFGEAVRWLQDEAKSRHFEITPDIAQYFVEYVGADQWRLSSELDKLMLSGRGVSKQLIQDVVEPTPQATSFELLDAAFGKRRERLEQLLAIVARQEDPYMFFGLLASQVYAIALVNSAGSISPDTIAKEASVHPYVLRKVAPLAKQLTSAELKRLVAGLAELDANMKSRAVEPWTQLTSFLLSLS